MSWNEIETGKWHFPNKMTIELIRKKKIWQQTDFKNCFPSSVNWSDCIQAIYGIHCTPAKHEMIAPWQNMWFLSQHIMKYLHPSISWSACTLANMKCLHPGNSKRNCNLENMEWLHPSKTWSDCTIAKHGAISPASWQSMEWLPPSKT